MVEVRDILVLGIDPAFASFGLAKAYLDIWTLEIRVASLVLIKTEKNPSKQIRRSSDNFRRAKELRAALIESLSFVKVAFAEIPQGTQSSTAATGLGIAVGVLTNCTVPIIEVSPMEVKLATVGKKKATKDEMIEWAIGEHPDAPWRTRKYKGEIVPINDNEHLADALATIYAGIKTEAFKTSLEIMRVGYKKPRRRRSR